MKRSLIHMNLKCFHMNGLTFHTKWLTFLMKYQCSHIGQAKKLVELERLRVLSKMTLVNMLPRQAKVRS